ncbi:MAG: NFACT RNA binding domain-containing protein [Treponema sp.]|jgi:predicted ribosome quality control (RQC) complex YloA/Tae2 family protein|nr:NFACT RNA binding domain-containing protein [Treponema sp.]
MSLNWKEINLILSELDLPGSQIQRVVQSTYDVIAFRLYGRGKSQTLLVALSPGACRLHGAYRAVPKNDRPLRFAEFLNSRITNGRIEEAVQLGDNRIIRLRIRQGGEGYRLYIRLWSNAANLIVTDEEGTILDAMRRLPKRGEVTGGRYKPEEDLLSGPEPARAYEVREIPGPGSFNEKIDAWYAEQGGALSLEALREQARKSFEGRIGRLAASLERLRAKEGDYATADRYKEYGDIILANAASIASGDEWLEAENFYGGGRIRIKLEGEKSPAAQAEHYYELYRKAKKGLAGIRAEIESGEGELKRLEGTLARLLAETNPLALHKLLKTGGIKPPATVGADRKRPGLSFRRKDWLIIVGRDAAENDALLRNHVKGNDLWLHARDYPGAYVFIKQRAGKTVPLDILLEAGNLALFYSKGRNNGEGDLFYTPVKFLRRAKKGPRGLVIPTQEKNLHIKADEGILKELENCRIEK